jgi:hypothetical protein
MNSIFAGSDQMFRSVASIGFSIVLCLLAGCAHNYIEGTKVEDTRKNRQILEVVEQLRQALEHRDTDALLKLVSTQYFESMGTTSPKDDFSYAQFKEKVLPRSFEMAKEVYVSFQIHEVKVKGDKAQVDLRYNTRIRLDLPAGSEWKNAKDFDRVELIREAGTWKIVRGL